MRNQIAHEYTPDSLYDLVPEVIEMTNRLVENIQCCRIFITQRKWMNG